MNDHVISPSRRPIIIADSHMSTGEASATVRHDDAEALLRDYLRLIRRVRNQQRARSIALRRTDIETLARHLDWSDEQVLARLADLMGATRHQRATMLAVLATGAALITVVSPMSAAAVDSQHGSPGQSVPLVVVDADELTYTRTATSARPAARVVASAEHHSATPRHAPVLDAQAGPTASEQGSARHDFAPPADPAAPSVADELAPPSVPPAPASEPAVGPDGATVAVGQPPVPPTAPSETGVDADGNTVAVGQPPVRPAPAPEQVDGETAVDSSTGAAALPTEREAPVESAAAQTGTDPDGNTVAVGQPPVPPVPEAETGTDADGNTVAVGQPPVPPTPDA